MKIQSTSEMSPYLLTAVNGLLRQLLNTHAQCVACNIIADISIYASLKNVQ